MPEPPPRPDRIRFTERLRLEPMTTEHAADLFRLHLDPAINEWWDTTWTPDDAAAEAARFEAGWATDGISKWMAYDRDTSALVGRGGMTRLQLDGAVRLEVGWAVLGERWGRGYATEIGRESLAVAFDELGADQVVAFTEPHNERSRAVMERLGLAYRRDIVHDGYAMVLYAIDRADPV